MRRFTPRRSSDRRSRDVFGALKKGRPVQGTGRPVNQIRGVVPYRLRSVTTSSSV